MADNAIVVVQSFTTEAEAQIAKGLLKSSGIEAMIRADTAGRMRDHLAWSGLGHQVLVREEDLAAAKKVLASPETEGLVLLHKATLIQAEVLQEALLSADIFATVNDDGIYYQIFVTPEDLEAARKVFAALPNL
jgi:hypothetical protein